MTLRELSELKTPNGKTFNELVQEPGSTDTDYFIKWFFGTTKTDLDNEDTYKTILSAMRTVLFQSKGRKAQWANILTVALWGDYEQFLLKLHDTLSLCPSDTAYLGGVPRDLTRDLIGISLGRYRESMDFFVWENSYSLTEALAMAFDDMEETAGED